MSLRQWKIMKFEFIVGTEYSKITIGGITYYIRINLLPTILLQLLFENVRDVSYKLMSCSDFATKGNTFLKCRMQIEDDVETFLKETNE